MTGYTVHTGSTKKFSDAWDRIFSGGKADSGKKSSRKSTKKTAVKSQNKKASHKVKSKKKSKS